MGKMKIRRFLTTKRTLGVEIFYKGSEVYFRTREIAGVLGVKQQFELTADIKKSLGENVIKNGLYTADFRNIEDDDRTTFISAKNIKRFLEREILNHKVISTQKIKLLNELSKY